MTATTSHGDVEDMEAAYQLTSSLVITNAVRIEQSMSHLFLARCMYVCTLRMLMKNTVQLVVHNAITIVNSAKVCVLANL